MRLRTGRSARLAGKGGGDGGEEDEGDGEDDEAAASFVLEVSLF